MVKCCTPDREVGVSHLLRLDMTEKLLLDYLRGISLKNEVKIEKALLMSMKLKVDSPK